MRSTTVYASAAILFAFLTAVVFATHGSGSYMFVLYGALLAVVFAGFAYDERRSRVDSMAARTP